MSDDHFQIKDSLIKEIANLGLIYSKASLSEFTTFRTGGIADYIFEAKDEASLVEAINIFKKEHVPIHIIGGGSNLLISDMGLRGVVVKIANDISSIEINNKEIYAPAFMLKEKFMESVINAGFGAIEFMAGIPGTIGGGIFMNAGTYMGDFASILSRIKIIDEKGYLQNIDVNPKIFSYRNMGIPDNSVILGGFFSLPDIERDERDKLKEKIRDIINERWQKHPMEYPSAGSVFKNPEGYSSWKLINDSGLKGFSIGGAMVSTKHTNFIINTGNALSMDIYKLIKHIQAVVYDKFSVRLETEIKFMGDFLEDV